MWQDASPPPDVPFDNRDEVIEGNLRERQRSRQQAAVTIALRPGTCHGQGGGNEMQTFV